MLRLRSTAAVRALGPLPQSSTSSSSHISSGAESWGTSSLLRHSRRLFTSHGMITPPKFEAAPIVGRSQQQASKPLGGGAAGPSSSHRPPVGEGASAFGRGLLGKGLRQYLLLCRARPLFAVACTSLTLWGLGDVTTQVLEQLLAKKDMRRDIREIQTSHAGTTEAERRATEAAIADRRSHPLPLDDGLNLRRLWSTLIFGTFVAGVAGHYWYRVLDHVVSGRMGLKEGSARFIACKLGLECLIWHPVGLSAFWLLQGMYAEGKTFAAVRKELRRDLLPALGVEVAMWTPIDIINFRYTPVHLQVIVVNFVSFFEAIVLSYLHSVVLAHPHPSE